MAAALILGGAALGFWLGWLVRPVERAGFVAEVLGSPPHWSVDHIAQQACLAVQRVEERRGPEVEVAVRAARIRFVDHPFLAHLPNQPNPHGQPAAVYHGGQIILQDGPGWERRLAWALCQHVRLTLHGEVGREGDADLIQADAAVREVVGDVR